MEEQQAEETFSRKTRTPHNSSLGCRGTFLFYELKSWLQHLRGENPNEKGDVQEDGNVRMALVEPHSCRDQEDNVGEEQKGEYEDGEDHGTSF